MEVVAERKWESRFIDGLLSCCQVSLPGAEIRWYPEEDAENKAEYLAGVELQSNAFRADSDI